jgi:hypothetical protein
LSFIIVAAIIMTLLLPLLLPCHAIYYLFTFTPLLRATFHFIITQHYFAAPLRQPAIDAIITPLTIAAPRAIIAIIIDCYYCHAIIIITPHTRHMTPLRHASAIFIIDAMPLRHALLLTPARAIVRH